MPILTHVPLHINEHSPRRDAHLNLIDTDYLLKKSMPTGNSTNETKDYHMHHHTLNNTTDISNFYQS